MDKTAAEITKNNEWYLMNFNELANFLDDEEYTEDDLVEIMLKSNLDDDCMDSKKTDVAYCLLHDILANQYSLLVKILNSIYKLLNEAGGKDQLASNSK